MRQTSRLSAVIAAALAAQFAGAFAQNGDASSPAAAQQPDFRVSVDLVTLDVIPRAATGQFVPDMTVGDFQVAEDGVAQTVASLVMVHGGRVFNVLRPPDAATSTAAEGIILPKAKPATDSAGRIFVLLVDDLHFTATETPLVRQLLKKVVAQLFHPGDMLAMFSTGPSSIELPVSYDKRLLQDAISRVGGHGMSYRDIMDTRDGAQGPQGLQSSNATYRQQIPFIRLRQHIFVT